jgi:hypothetical protein
MRRLAIPATLVPALVIIAAGFAEAQARRRGADITLTKFRVKVPSSYTWTVRKYDRESTVEFSRKVSIKGSPRTTTIRVEPIAVPTPYKPTPLEVQATRLREQLAADGRLRARKMRMSTGPMAQAIVTVGCWRVYTLAYSIRSRKWPGRPWATKEETASYVLFPPNFVQNRNAYHFRSRQTFANPVDRSPSEMAEVFDLIRSFEPTDGDEPVGCH